MVTPISNDKILPSDGRTSSSGTEKNRADKEATTRGSANSENTSKDEHASEASSVDVERANQIYKQSASKPSSGKNNIANQEQARAIVADIRTQIEENSLQALQAQAGSNTAGLSTLLEAAPL